MHEKEREFFDALRLIIQNGYQLQQNDFLDILRFIKLQELAVFDSKQQVAVINFLKEAAKLLEFEASIVDVAVREMLQQGLVNS